MQYKHNKNLVSYAKKLRKEMTKEEKHLWYDFLQKYHKKFIRQKILGKYIVDFYCAEAKIVIEVDGSQHFEKEGKEKDLIRDNFLKGYDLTVLRISNKEVNENFEGVCLFIDNRVKEKLGGEQSLRHTGV